MSAAVAAGAWPVSGLGFALQWGAQGHVHRGVEAGLPDQQPDDDQAQHD